MTPQASARQSGPQPDQVLKVLKRHIGRDNAITASEIAQELGFTPGVGRSIRAIIAYDFWPDIIVCGTGGQGSGYYIASDYDEVQAYHRHLSQLADKASFKRENLETKAKRLGLHLLTPPPSIHQTHAQN